MSYKELYLFEKFQERRVRTLDPWVIKIKKRTVEDDVRVNEPDILILLLLGTNPSYVIINN